MLVITNQGSMDIKVGEELAGPPGVFCRDQINLPEDLVPSKISSRLPQGGRR